MAHRWIELIIDIDGVEVTEKEMSWGKEYIFFDNDNKFILNIVELTIEEFKELSIKENDFEEYNIIKDFDVKTIAGYDWEIIKGNDKACIWKAFKVFEKVGQRHSNIYFPEILYYRYDDERAHEAYRRWIEIIDFKLIHHKEDIAVYYREKDYEI